MGFVFPPQDERAALAPAGTAKIPFAFDHCPATPRALPHLVLVDGRRLDAMHDLSGVVGDGGHEPLGIKSARFDFPQLGLPLTGQLRRLQPLIIDHSYQISAQIRCSEGLVVADDVAAFKQSLDDCGSRGRRSHAALLEGFFELVIVYQFAGSFHCPQQRVFRERLGRSGFATFDERLVRTALARATAINRVSTAL